MLKFNNKLFSSIFSAFLSSLHRYALISLQNHENASSFIQFFLFRFSWWMLFFKKLHYKSSISGYMKTLHTIPKHLEADPSSEYQVTNIQPTDRPVLPTCIRSTTAPPYPATFLNTFLTRRGYYMYVYFQANTFTLSQLKKCIKNFQHEINLYKC